MNQDTLKSIYRTLDPSYYYKEYFQGLSQRVDGRKFDQHRAHRISHSQNQVVVRRGNNILIAVIAFTKERVTFSPVTNSYDRSIIDIQIKTGVAARHNYKFQKYLQLFLRENIDWKEIQSQLVNPPEPNGHLTAQIGHLKIKILETDGSILSCILEAAYLLLRKSIASKPIKISKFLMATTYAEIMGRIVADPTHEQEKDASLIITFICDIFDPQRPIKQIYDQKNQSEDAAQSIISLYESQKTQLIETMKIKQRE